ncbi:MULTISPECIES: hypothetical protein [Burkholderia]|uniref:Uncharacterized protein n=1 Tax=Burkholderia anthinoferrum TaxID=3090833 RepID=A0ABU5WUZ3_9BURK|nr:MULTISPECIES: hypothetical protein [Burkholderia]MEB2504090.1 hypothetical protein [Burkholderia anthinoferrum]MEB2535515.1 hypothetical protein [Burkholderia anthinoferrum]MEB2563891.1 hypothetical protein [Burkholderia anthinoferrum]MEB2582818.1 hypothetical protein [Burkholderia anthinoferrum]MDF3100508.1 hypothetical protein [Burkholderia semiarida]
MTPVAYIGARGLPLCFETPAGHRMADLAQADVMRRRRAYVVDPILAARAARRACGADTAPCSCRIATEIACQVPDGLLD